MELTLYTANPAGNITLLVETPVPRHLHQKIARQLLAKRKLHGEQVGFLAEPQMGGAVRLEMMGGEFCGNAARSVGYYHAMKTGCGREVAVEISGCGTVLQVGIDGDSAWTQMPVPMALEPVIVGGYAMTAVHFEGISHLVAEIPPLSEKAVAELLPDMAAQFHVPAVGMLFVEGDGMTPVVYVRDTDSVFWESSCASGSAAVACWYASKELDGIFREYLIQPGGAISTEVIRKNGCTVSVRIGGKIKLGNRMTVILDDENEFGLLQNNFL